MPTINVTKSIDASAARVWQVLAEYGDVARWNPNIADCHALSGPGRGVGAARQCDMPDGKNYIRERVIEWQEGAVLGVEVYEGTMPVENATARIVLNPTPNHATRVEASMSYSPKAGWLAALMDLLMFRPMLRRSMRKLLLGLQHEAEQNAAESERPPAGTRPAFS